jgi:hypothetical protein
MAVETAVVLGATVRLTTAPGLALNRLRVKPSTAPVTVFVALDILIPLMVSEAFKPLAAAAKAKLVPVEVAVKLPALPEVLLVSTSRAPEVSVAMLAVTPTPALFMEFSRSVIVSVPLVVSVTPDPLLSVRVKLSAGRAVVALATVVEENDAVLARFVTTTEVFPAGVPDAAVAVTTLLLEDATVL